MFERRSLLKAGVAADLLPAIAAPARAQSLERSRDAILAIARAKGQAENLLALALYSNLSADQAAAIEGVSERIFNAITGVLGGIPAEEAAVYAEPAQTIISDQMTELGVPLAPQTAVPVFPATSSQAASEELPAIMGDIIKDAFGVKDLDSAGLTLIASQPDFADSTAFDC